MIKHLLCLLLALAAPTLAQPTSQPVDVVLDQLDAAGKGIKSFSTDIKITTTNTDIGDDSARTGTVHYQLRDDGSARIHVVLDKRLENNRIYDERVEYLLDGPTLWDRSYRTLHQGKHEVLKPGQKINLLKLGEGPFPLPIGQSKADVHAIFDVAPIPPASDDPPNTNHLQLVPKPDSQFARQFKTIDVWPNQTSGMPQRIATLDQNGKELKTTDFSNFKLNPTLTDSDFTLPKIDESKWQTSDEPTSEGSNHETNSSWLDRPVACLGVRRRLLLL